jgi:HEAT repeat protein
MTTASQPPNDSPALTRFQRQADTEALIAHGVSQGLSEAKLRACIVRLEPVFQSLRFGEQPPYEQLDRAALLSSQPEIEFVVRSMAQSSAADLKTAGFHVMSMLDLKSFIPDLQAGLASSEQWERVEAVRALGSMNRPEVRAILLSAAKHPELQTRRAAAEALNRFDR